MGNICAVESLVFWTDGYSEYTLWLTGNLMAGNEV
jgi:hypothetical protein